MQGPFLQEMLASVQAVGRWFYWIAWLIWAGALVFAGYRIYQIRTQVLVPAEVLKSGVYSYTEGTRDRDMDGFTQESGTTTYVPEATVRYEVNGKAVTGEIRRSGVGFRWIGERMLRQWKPGARIQVRVDPAAPEKPRPALGVNYATFDGSFMLALGGFCFAGFGWLWIHGIDFVVRKFTAHVPLGK